MRWATRPSRPWVQLFSLVFGLSTLICFWCMGENNCWQLFVHQLCSIESIIFLGLAAWILVPSPLLDNGPFGEGIRHHTLTYTICLTGWLLFDLVSPLHHWHQSTQRPTSDRISVPIPSCAPSSRELDSVDCFSTFSDFFGKCIVE